MTRGSLHHDTMHKLKVASDARVKLNFEFCSTCNFWCECDKLICVIWMRFPEKRQQHASIMWKQRKSLSLHSHSLNPRSCILPRYMYSVYITYEIEIAVYNITDYFAMVWQWPTHPCMNITRRMPQYRGGTGEKIKVFIINFCFSL